MTLKKQLLNYLLDIGGVATLNNLYSPTAQTYKGSLVKPRDCLQFWLKDKYVEYLDRTYKPVNETNERYFQITKKGANFIDRDDYKQRKSTKTVRLDQVIHESYKFDVLVSFLRLFPDFYIDIDFLPKDGVRPDACIKMRHKENENYKLEFYLEIERKKTIDRAYDTACRYKEFLKKHRMCKVLIVYSDSLSYPDFIRPQQYELHRKKIETTEKKTRQLSVYKELSHHFLFMPQSDFHRLNEAVWYSQGKLIKLIN